GGRQFGVGTDLFEGLGQHGEPCGGAASPVGDFLEDSPGGCVILKIASRVALQEEPSCRHRPGAVPWRCVSAWPPSGSSCLAGPESPRASATRCSSACAATSTAS